MDSPYCEDGTLKDPDSSSHIEDKLDRSQDAPEGSGTPVPVGGMLFAPFKDVHLARTL